MTASTPTTAPTAASERIGELDVLRGFALFGVFSVHVVTSLYYLHPVDEAIFAAWTDDAFQYGLLVICDILFLDKAITLFSVLFGIGFWVQMERLEARGEGFERVYLRRLVVLLGFGLVNKFLIFPGDILVDYALLGFALFFLRRLSARAMLIVGAALILVVSQLAYGFLGPPWIDGDALDQMLSDGLMAESYGAWVAQIARWHVQDNIAGLGIISLALFVLGRFLIGAWIARHRLIEKARVSRPRVKKMAAVCIFFGLTFESLAMVVWEEIWVLPEAFDYVFHAIGVPLLALGYACLLIVMCGAPRWAWLSEVFASVGRMALTAYIAHGFLILVFAHPFGVYIRPALSPAASWLVSIGVFLGFSLLCRLWLNAFRFGPLEWVWRSLTYGEVQSLRATA